jgi:predicted nucleic acid-binding protein
MKARVVDASVVAAAFFRELYSERARELLSGGDPLLAPDLIHSELANVIWKRWSRKEIDAGEAAQLLQDFLNLPLRIAPSAGLAEIALQLSIETRRTVYDCLYLALAMRNKVVVVTSDRRLVNALAHSPLTPYVAWIGEPL